MQLLFLGEDRIVDQLVNLELSLQACSMYSTIPRITADTVITKEDGHFISSKKCSLLQFISDVLCHLFQTKYVLQSALSYRCSVLFPLHPMKTLPVLVILERSVENFIFFPGQFKKNALQLRFPISDSNSLLGFLVSSFIVQRKRTKTTERDKSSYQSNTKLLCLYN